MIYKAVIAVDEKGTEVAAAVAGMMMAQLGPRVSITVNKPFIFIIRDEDKGTILFIGRMLNPLEN